jgi:hypothetical protein
MIVWAWGREKTDRQGMECDFSPWLLCDLTRVTFAWEGNQKFSTKGEAGNCYSKISPS